MSTTSQSPAVLCVFDVLVAGTQDMRERWQLRCKEWLREHLPEIGPVSWLGHVHQHGVALFQQAVDSDGIVAKSIGSPYTAGRHEHWIKIKNPNYSRQEALE